MNIYLENDTFQDWMKAVQAKVEVSLTKHLPPAVVPLKLHEAMGYAVLDGGKRVRPLLVYAAGMLSINQDDPAHHEVLESAACAVEMIHAYSLVHDDMPCMDDDALRRGKPTVHKKYGEATALLVGDALQSQAFFVLSKANAPADRVLFMMQILTHASGSAGMCGGQAIDLDSVGLPLSITELEVMHLLKTGALVRASVFLGAVAGGFMRNNELKALDQYANAVGLAFQVIDDILDATSDSATLGKTAGKDAADNKPTYVSLLGLEGSLELAVKLQKMAHSSLRMFGDTAQLLHELADYIVQRKA